MKDSSKYDHLFEQAMEAAHNAYVPYSHFRVGAALLLDDGSVITGVNVENRSYGLTNCAERTAIFRAVAMGKRILPLLQLQPPMRIIRWDRAARAGRLSPNL